jgi:type I restriction enzyme M protein
MARGKKAQYKGTSVNLGFGATLGAAADKLHALMDAVEYKPVVLRLIFPKYISDSFEEHRGKLIAGKSQEAAPENSEEYRAENIFWVAKRAPWSHFQANARQPTIGNLSDDAMEAMEREDKSLKGVLFKDYDHPALREVRLGELIDLVGTIGLGDRIVARSVFLLLPEGGPS